MPRCFDNRLFEKGTAFLHFLKMYVYSVFQRPEPFSTGSEAQGDRHDRGDHRDRDRGEPAWANSQAESAHLRIVSWRYWLYWDWQERHAAMVSFFHDSRCKCLWNIMEIILQVIAVCSHLLYLQSAYLFVAMQYQYLYYCMLDCQLTCMLELICYIDLTYYPQDFSSNPLFEDTLQKRNWISCSWHSYLMTRVTPSDSRNETSFSRSTHHVACFTGWCAKLGGDLQGHMKPFLRKYRQHSAWHDLTYEPWHQWCIHFIHGCRIMLQYPGIGGMYMTIYDVILYVLFRILCILFFPVEVLWIMFFWCT